MVWTLVTFVIVMLVLRRYAFPRIAKALDERRRAIEESIDEAERSRQQAEQLLEDYRGRLKEAREQSEDIVARAERAAKQHEEEAKEQARQDYEDHMEKAKRDIEQETRRAIDDIRREVGDLTVMATEKVIRRELTDEDHQRLIDESLDQAEFSRLSSARDSSDGNGGGSSR
jgi:F-type H+-transporting ATPase subunit b